MPNRGLIHQYEKLCVSETVYIINLNVHIEFLFWVNIRDKEEKFENTNRVIRSRKSKDIQYNGQKDKQRST